MAAGVMATVAPWASTSVLERMTLMRPLPWFRCVVDDDYNSVLGPIADNRRADYEVIMPKYFMLIPGRERRWIYLQGGAEVEVVEVPDGTVAEWARAARNDREAFRTLVEEHIVNGDTGKIVAMIDASGFSDFSNAPLER